MLPPAPPATAPPPSPAAPPASTAFARECRGFLETKRTRLLWVGGDYAHSGLLTYLYFAILVVDLAYLGAVILVGRAGAPTPVSEPAPAAEAVA